MLITHAPDAPIMAAVGTASCGVRFGLARARHGHVLMRRTDACAADKCVAAKAQLFLAHARGTLPLLEAQLGYLQPTSAVIAAPKQRLVVMPHTLLPAARCWSLAAADRLYLQLPLIAPVHRPLTPSMTASSPQ